MAEELIAKKKEPMGGFIMLIFWWAMILFALQASTHMVGAGDTWVAMACGRHFLNHGVNTVEPFSANSHRPGPTMDEVKTWPNWAQWITDKVGLDTVKYWHPTGWVDQNWLTHVFFYWLTHLSPVKDAETFDKPIVEQHITYDSLVYWKYAIYIITVIVVYYTGRQLGANKAISAIFACFALFIGRTFFDIRPAGFSNMLTAVLLFIFVLVVYKNYLYIWLIVPLTVLWCNLHGGYIYIFIVLVPFIGLHLLSLLPKRISMSLFYILCWLFFYALPVKFLSHENLIPIKVSSDVMLYFILFTAVFSLAMGFLKDIKAAVYNFYHILITAIVFIVSVIRFFPAGIDRQMSQFSLFADYVNDSRQAFFISFIGFVVVALLLSAFKHRLKIISIKAWWHTVAASVIAFIAMIIFNPFHLTNLTHTFIVTVSEHAKLWKTVNEWHPAFEWNNPVGDEIPFLVMYIIAWVLLALWVVCLLLKPRLIIRKGKPKVDEQPEQVYQWPLIDLPLLVIAALTIYMAIGSRRFIPIAAIAACPILAMFLDSGIRMIVATVNLRINGKAVLSNFPVELQRCFAAAILAVVIFLSIWWGYWYKAIYLNSWPDSNYLSSVFMRMSASYAKPFKACQFVRDNKMRGIVFNYWTEGGFVAYGQFPDPNGKTPLQLVMDGRAQAAYNTEAYQHWMYVMSGGDPARAAERAGRNYTASDYEAIGQWLDQELKKENVWVIFMPDAQFDSVLIKGIATNPGWRPAYMDDEQEIYVDVQTQQGRDLYTGIFNNKTKFPDDFSKYLTAGYNILRVQDENNVEIASDFFTKALASKPSTTAVIELIHTAARNSKIRDKITDVLNKYFEDYEANKKTYIKQDGYRDRLVVMMIIGDYLSKINPAFAQKYQEYVKQFNSEQIYIGKTSRW